MPTLHTKVHNFCSLGTVCYVMSMLYVGTYPVVFGLSSTGFSVPIIGNLSVSSKKETHNNIVGRVEAGSVMVPNRQPFVCMPHF